MPLTDLGRREISGDNGCETTGYLCLSSHFHKCLLCTKQFVVFPMFTPFCEVSSIVLLLLFLNMAKTQHFAELLLTPAALEQGEEDAFSLLSDTAAFVGLG